VEEREGCLILFVSSNSRFSKCFSIKKTPTSFMKTGEESMVEGRFWGSFIDFGEQSCMAPSNAFVLNFQNQL
jgi:hypothetical protein